MSKTLIIGAGPAGLAVAGRLRMADSPFEVFEASHRVANAWHDHYDRLHLHTVKQLSHLPGAPFPDHFPTYVPRADLVSYYEAYAERFDIWPRFGTEVTRVEAAGSGWATVTADGRRFDARNVVIATGVNRIPNRPDFDGEETYTGDIIHSREYRNPHPFIGRRILVVGMGNTGAEIALDLSEHRVEVAISVRSPVNIVPRDVLGRPTQFTARTLSKLPDAVADRIGLVVRRLTVGDLTAFGIEAPELSPAAQLRERGRTPVIDVGTVAAIRSRQITVRPGISRFDSGSVRFTDGTCGEYDAIVLATGYRPALEPVLDEPGELLDESGIPRHVVCSGRHAGLFFVGFDNHRPGGILGTVLDESEQVVSTIAG